LYIQFKKIETGKNLNQGETLFRLVKRKPDPSGVQHRKNCNRNEQLFLGRFPLLLNKIAKQMDQLQPMKSKKIGNM
jgi:hypothetical protein